MEEAAGSDSGAVVAAVGRGLRRRLGRKYRYDDCSHYLLSIGGVRAFFYQYGSHFSVQCGGAGDGKL
jgi:hypothetical protein